MTNTKSKSDKPEAKPAASVPDLAKPNQTDAEKIDMTPDAEHNNVSQPGPTAFVENPTGRPDSKGAEHENTPLENVGPLPGKNLSAERIVQVWDGGERIIAGNMAKEAKKGDRDRAVEARPELLRYIAGDPG